VTRGIRGDVPLSPADAPGSLVRLERVGRCDGAFSRHHPGRHGYRRGNVAEALGGDATNTACCSNRTVDSSPASEQPVDVDLRPSTNAGEGVACPTRAMFYLAGGGRGQGSARHVCEHRCALQVAINEEPLERRVKLADRGTQNPYRKGVWVDSHLRHHRSRSLRRGAVDRRSTSPRGSVFGHDPASGTSLAARYGAGSCRQALDVAGSRLGLRARLQAGRSDSFFEREAGGSKVPSSTISPTAGWPI